MLGGGGQGEGSPWMGAHGRMMTPDTTPELDPVSFDLPPGVARIDIDESDVVVRYTPDWTRNALFTNARDLARSSGKPVIVTFEEEQFWVYPRDDRNDVMTRYAVQRTPADPDSTYHPPERI